MEPVTVSKKGDLLITCKGTIGTMLFNNIGDVHIARQVMAIRTILCNMSYIMFFLEWYLSSLQKKAKSIIPGISRDDLLKAFIPLPPFEEQKRIEEKMSLIRHSLEMA